jgi:hypothetical protein
MTVENSLLQFTNYRVFGFVTVTVILPPRTITLRTAAGEKVKMFCKVTFVEKSMYTGQRMWS